MCRRPMLVRPSLFLGIFVPTNLVYRSIQQFGVAPNRVLRVVVPQWKFAVAVCSRTGRWRLSIVSGFREYLTARPSKWNLCELLIRASRLPVYCG
jgi:hypothetical protein